MSLLLGEGDGEKARGLDMRILGLSIRGQGDRILAMSTLK